MRDARLTLVNDTDTLGEFLRWLGERHSCIALDTETEGLEFWNCDVRLVQVGDTEAGWAFPWHLWGGAALAAVREYEGPVVGHNIAFDVKFIEEHSEFTFQWPKLHDTSIMSHILHPNQSRALKAVCDRHLGTYASAAQKRLDQLMHENKWDFKSVPLELPQYWGYACIDTVLTARLYEHCVEEIKSSYANVYDLEMRVAPILMNMERRGAPVDLVYCASKRDELSSYVAETEDYVRREYGVRMTSNTALAQRFIEQGVQLTKRTPGGAWSVDAEVLEELEEQGVELASLVLNARRASKIVSTYLENFITMNVRGSVHPNINQLGARTGRMSVSQPALQTLTRGTVVRDAFVPSEGNILLTADSDQIEMRLLAHFCQDPGLIEAINTGDLHTATARLVYNDPDMTKRDPRRQTAKNAGFAKIYGAGIKQFARTAGITESEASAFLTAYDQRFPGVVQFQRHVEKVARDRLRDEGEAFVTAPSGRRHPADHQYELYKLVNYLIQGTAGDVLKEQLISLDNAGLGPYMVLPVHDEVVFDVPKEDASDIMVTIADAMTMRTPWTVPLTVGVDGPYERWGDKFR